MQILLQQHQTRLNQLGFDAGNPDGSWGKRTEKAVRDFQAANGLVADGQLGPKTAALLTSAMATGPAKVGPALNRTISTKPELKVPTLAATAWPRQKDVSAVYGPPGGSKATAGTCSLPFAFKLAWDLDAEVKSFKCHELCADAFTTIFEQAAKHYGEELYRKLRLDLFGGCYNLRAMRGGTAFSMHSWGIAVDLDPERNQLKWGNNKASFAQDDYVPFWNIVEGQGATSLGRERSFDWMHFQFARL